MNMDEVENGKFHEDLLKTLEILDNKNGDHPSSGSATTTSERIFVKGSSQVSTSSPLLDTEQMQSDDPTICPYCHEQFRKPRVLDCLHSMCEDCMIAQLDGRNQKQSSCLEFELECTFEIRPTPPGVIRCPVCGQETNVGNDPQFVNTMLLDYIRIREFGIVDKNDTKICRACKGREEAVANCLQCCSDLCIKCVQAHRDMKMFDGHKVLMFSETEKSDGITKGDDQDCLPIPICTKHQGEFEQFCPACEELLCKICVIDHIDHNISPLNDTLYNFNRQNIQTLAHQAELKGKLALDARSSIPDRMSLLKESYEKCREKIDKAFQFYAHVLNDVKLDILVNLDKHREEKEEYLDSLYQKIDMQTSRMQDALSFTNKLLEKGSVIDLFMQKKKVWQQLKLLMHSMPDVNAEVDLDYDVLSKQDFQKKLEYIAGTVKCRATGIPKDSKNLSLLMDMCQQNKQTAETDVNQPLVIGWEMNSSFSQQQIQPINPQGPGTIGMERRLNRSSNGNSYLSGDSGIFSSASDMTLSSPINNQLGALGLDAFSMNRLGISDSYGTGFRTPTQTNFLQGQLDTNQHLGSGGHFSDNFFTNNTQAKAWNTPNNYNGSQQNVFGSNFDAVSGNIQRPRELMNFGATDFPPFGGMDSSIMRSRSSLCTTPSIEPFGGNALLASPNPIPMSIKYIFGSNASNTQDQFNTPQGLTLGLDNEVAIADTNNHRCLVTDLRGNFLRNIGSSGTEEGSVYYPKKIVALIRGRDCRFIVLDRGSNQQFNRLQLFKNDGVFISKLALPCQIDQVTVMTINKEKEQLVIIDNKNTVHVFDFEAFNQLRLSRHFSISGYVHEASDIAIYNNHYYITDYKMHGIVVYSTDGKQMAKFGGLNITPYPVGIDFSKNGDILVGDSHGNHFHIVVFDTHGQQQHHYRCYQQKVSRCTGLKLTSEGYLCTMSRQNSSIIVFDTLYVVNT